MNTQQPTAQNLFGSRVAVPLSIMIWLLAPITVRANPVSINGTSALAFGIVAFWALVIEAGIVALLLTFSGVATLRIFSGFFATNFLVFVFLFFPMLHRIPLALLEAFVVMVDGAAIKLLTSFDSLQRDDCRGVSLVRAGLVSAAGNAVSFFVGVLAMGSPWEDHTIPGAFDS
jgi:hypothetical protein